MKENRSRFAWVFAGFLLFAVGGRGAGGIERNSEQTRAAAGRQPVGRSRLHRWAPALYPGRIGRFGQCPRDGDIWRITASECAFALADVRSVRTLGDHRIQTRSAAISVDKSMLSALALETVVPGWLRI